MVYDMKLHDGPFAMIASGIKTIELRLYDEKRREIRVGDRIVFSKSRHPSEKIETEVIALYKFPDFEQLYKALPLDKCGYLPEEVSKASSKDMEVYYSAEKQARYGVIGIEIRLSETSREMQ